MRSIGLLAGIYVFCFIFSGAVYAQDKELFSLRGKKFLNSRSESDSSIDVQYYRLDLNPEFPTRSLSGTTDIRFKLKDKSRGYVILNLSEVYSIDTILWNDQIVQFTRNINQLLIHIPASAALNDIFTVRVKYHGQPPNSGFGSFSFTLHSNQPAIWTLSEPFGAEDWFACKNALNDKADSADIYITADPYFVSVSNGILVSSGLNDNGTKTYHWHCSYPIAHYLISVAMANYLEYKQWYRYSVYDSMLVTHYIYPEHFEGIKSALDKTSGMIGLFSAKFGQYPFIREKYGHAEFGWGGGMEHQTVTSLGSFSEEIIAHELAHQWFGDQVTCADWRDIWLNEGFATYAESIYLENMFGRTAYDESILSNMITAKRAVGSIFVQDISAVGNIFDYARTYAKSAVVLHMLRGIVGDSIFYAMLQGYLTHPDLKYGSASTADLQHICESIFHADLSYFFMQWIYGENYPRYQMFWRKKKLSEYEFETEVHLIQSKNTAPDFFIMPVQIQLLGTNSDSIFSVFNNVPDQIFKFYTKFEPGRVIFDPRNLILKDIFTVDFPIEFYEERSLKVFPNYPDPAGDKTNVLFYVPHDMDIAMKIFNLAGECVWQEPVRSYKYGIYTKSFNTVNLAQGVYVLSIESQKEKCRNKFIVVR